MDKQEIAALRRKHIADNLSLSYKNPLHIVRGEGQYLFDNHNNRYLDLVNNVAHVGHCHPHIVQAATEQLKVLNTNTRYYDENLVRYAQELLKYFPPELSVVYFVNSGSEANDLALRLARAVRHKRHKRHVELRRAAAEEREALATARVQVQPRIDVDNQDNALPPIAYTQELSNEEKEWYTSLLAPSRPAYGAASANTGGLENSTCSACSPENIICLDHAYHGHTQACIDVSPYKFNGRGGAGCKPHVYVARSPDVFRLRMQKTARGYGSRVDETVIDDMIEDDTDEVALATFLAQDIQRLGQKMFQDHTDASHAQRRLRGCMGSGEGLDSQADTKEGKCCNNCCAGCCGRPIAFIAESAPGCAGQIILPPGYLSAAFRHARELGAICIADEVQVGFGRVGTAMWGFQTQKDIHDANALLMSEEPIGTSVDDGLESESAERKERTDYVIPDIVTLGKPAGNGWPIAAVVTTRRVSQAFSQTGMEYFNTFGGSTASARVGRAVLEVLEKEHLRQNAARVGAHLLQALKNRIASRYPYIIGDVRGLGLYVGIEIIRWLRGESSQHNFDANAPLASPTGPSRDSSTLSLVWEPAAEETSWIADKLVVDHRILISTDGPDHNVLKIKPPICITIADVDYFIMALDLVLQALPDSFTWIKPFMSGATAPSHPPQNSLRSSKL